MDWTPKKWIAAVLGFFLPPLGMLYVVQLKWAVIYFGLSFVIFLSEYISIHSFDISWLQYVSFNWLVMIVCSIHAYKLARQFSVDIVRPWYSKWYGLVSIPVIFILVIFNIRTFLFEPFRFPSSSMFPTINPGAVLITKKLGYGNYASFGIKVFKSEVTADIHRGDIVVFEYPENPAINYAKRIIGLPGDTIKYFNKKLYINGTPVKVTVLSDDANKEVLKENLGNVSYTVQNMKIRPNTNFQVSVPDGKYFVMGDNRDNSRDSRYWGFLPKQNLVGKTVYILQ